MKIHREVLQQLTRHAREDLPAECCGILLSQNDDPATISLALRAENAETERPGRRYVLGHKAHLRAVEMEFSGAARIVGYYHSHPQGDARPSPGDLRHAVEGAVYLIMSLRRGRVAHSAWRLGPERYAAETLEVSE